MIFLCVAIVFGCVAAFCAVMADRQVDGAVEAVEEGDWWR